MEDNQEPTIENVDTKLDRSAIKQIRKAKILKFMK